MSVEPSQRLDALAVANQQRFAMSALRAQIKQHQYPGGMAFVAGLLRNPSPTVEAMRVEVLLRHVHRMSDRKIVGIMSAAGILTVGRRVRDLTPRQRDLIAADLEDRARGWRARA